ncbi:CheY chemotaxis protein or a CheY-like REC (receiver) domain [Halopseudomonas xinjiangensis]|uniref:CheY chemotaxis protein or a CheY-like REC (Receiver) domain n=1 Tax=Halopseudomonas xinjiangensis TaxID=487184 RepID=A0A1H1XMI5_9GAMM|nr:response regulator [Halopseudomonas xinjiangensis]SDT10271.1 CheY chemotaxis protein or a CheY-like REC (receiver) domain [Halopseudomonas xinjiangensis]
MSKVLIVEDEALIAMLLEEMLADRGFEVAGQAATVEEGQDMAENLDFDAAILDVSLNGSYVFPIAERLDARGIPFVFTTGYGEAGLPKAWSDRPVFTKPYDIGELTEALTQLIPTSVS